MSVQRWPREAAQDQSWAKLDASRRGGGQLAEAAWRVRHTDGVNAGKLKSACLVWPAAHIAAWLLGFDLFWFVGFPGFWTCLFAECLLFLGWGYYTANHWRKQRKQTWSGLLLLPLPDSLYHRAQAFLKKKPGAGSKPRPAAKEPAPGTEAAAAAAAAAAAKTFLPPVQSAWGVQYPGLGGSGVGCGAAGDSVGPRGWGGGGGGGARSSTAWPLSPGGGSQYYGGGDARSPAFASPQSGAFGMGTAGGSFAFRATPAQTEKPPPPLPQLADDSFRAVLRVAGKVSTSLEAEGGLLQRAVFNHLTMLDKQLTEVEREILDMKDLRTMKLSQFSCINSLSEPLEGVQLQPQPQQGFGGFGQQQQAKPAEMTKEYGLKLAISHLSQELNVWGGDRPGRGDRIRMKQILHRRLKLERVMGVESNVPSAAHTLEYDTQSSQVKMCRVHRQKFLARLKSVVADGVQDVRKDTTDSEVVLHVVGALLDSTYFGSRRSISVEWSGAGGVLRYSSPRCPGFLHLAIEAMPYQGTSVFVLKHVDRDLGINTTYLTNPQRSLYEATLFFLMVFESKHPNKQRTFLSHDTSYTASSQSRFAVLSRQFWEEETGDA